MYVDGVVFLIFDCTTTIHWDGRNENINFTLINTGGLPVMRFLFIIISDDIYRFSILLLFIAFLSLKPKN